MADPAHPAPTRRGAIGTMLVSAAAAPAAAAAIGPAAVPGDPEGFALVLPPGSYDAAAIGARGKSIRIVAAIPGTVTIRVPDNGYLIDAAGFIDTVLLDGLRVVGGAGAVRLRNPNQNVAHGVTITRCEFRDYTVCAIGNNSIDHPWLRVRDCRFECAEGAPAIGIAWGGYVDCTVIEANIFSRNRYHIKIGPRLSGSIAIRGNDFMMSTRFDRRADIWFVPNDDPDSWGVNSGWGSTVENNKFGNEEQSPGAPRMLVAGEEPANGRDRTMRGHDPRWRTDAFLSGLTIRGNRISSIWPPRAAFLESHIRELRYLTWFDNKLDGGAYDYAVAFMDAAPDFRQDWTLILSKGDGPSIPTRGFTNNKAIPALIDDWPAPRKAAG